MKTNRTNAGLASTLILAALVAGPASGIVSAQNHTATPVAHTAGVMPVEIIRASTLMDMKVVSSDNQKVGEIADLVFDTASPQRLAYVVVTTGGFFSMGGVPRAVPASSIAVVNNVARIPISHAEFMAAPRLPGNRLEHLSQPQTVATLQGLYRAPVVSQTNTPGSLLSFADMKDGEVFSTVNGRLGDIKDAWVSLSGQRVPYIEFVDAFSPFHLPGPERYAVALTQLQDVNDVADDYTFAISLDDVRNAETVTHFDGKRITGASLGTKPVIRVKGVAVAANQR